MRTLIKWTERKREDACIHDFVNSIAALEEESCLVDHKYILGAAA